MRVCVVRVVRVCVCDEGVCGEGVCVMRGCAGVVVSFITDTYRNTRDMLYSGWTLLCCTQTEPRFCIAVGLSSTVKQCYFVQYIYIHV